MSICEIHPARAVPCSECAKIAIGPMIVYDQAPDVVYDPTVTNPRRVAKSGEDLQHARPRGFGNVTTRRMLEHGAPATAPWLTVELAEQELAIGAARRDRSQEALDSVR